MGRSLVVGPISTMPSVDPQAGPDGLLPSSEISAPRPAQSLPGTCGRPAAADGFATETDAREPDFDSASLTGLKGLREKPNMPAIIFARLTALICIVAFLACYGHWQTERGASSSFDLTYVSNAGFLLESDGLKILIDALPGSYDSDYIQLSSEKRAVLENAEAPFDGVNVVLATHFHHDHFGPESVLRYLRANPAASFVGTEQTVDQILSLPEGSTDIAARLHTASPPVGGTVAVSDHGSPGLRITAMDMHHGLDRDPPVENNAYLIDMGDWCVLHVGDTEITPQELDRFNLNDEIDLALVPPWFLMGPGWESVEEWRATLERSIRPRYVVRDNCHFRDTYKKSRRRSRE